MQVRGLVGRGQAKIWLGWDGKEETPNEESGRGMGCRVHKKTNSVFAVNDV